MSQAQLHSAEKSQTRKSRSAILRVAEKLFAKQGFRATTLRQISAKSGANGALVSYYFGGKEGLWEAVLSDKLESLDSLLSPITKKPGLVSLADLQEIMRGLFAYVREDQCFHQLALRTLLEDPALKKRITANLWHPFHERLTSLVHRASAGSFTMDEAELRAHVISGLVQKYGNLLCFYYDDISDSDEPEAVLARLESYVINELLPSICGKAYSN
ncbi:MAG: TetR/AcrR family transcriptional regulator [Bdellovibrionota bacterium]